MAMAQEIHTYADLLQQIHDDLRIQHPEWIEQDGESPMCDSYEARLMELLDASMPQNSRSLREVPQDLNSFLGRVGSHLVHADEDGRVLGWINRDHSAEP